MSQKKRHPGGLATCPTCRPTRGEVPVSKSLVLEICRNLGATKTVTAALVEKFLGPSWDFLIKNGGTPVKYAHRDRRVARIAFMLRDGLWKLEERD